MDFNVLIILFLSLSDSMLFLCNFPICQLLGFKSIAGIGMLQLVVFRISTASRYDVATGPGSQEFCGVSS